ncbi:MAG: TonB-dependent receptor [Oligoflexia bacterium]|nr:TonB-dependent receptor [Oligoflexia bacterium]
MRFYIGGMLTACVVALCPSRPASADPISPTHEIVVSATRIESDRREVASSVSVISAEQIEARGVSEVKDILKDVAGVDVVQSGGAGGNTSIFIRGANSEHTLVLIDGIEANNPINPTRAYDFSNLTLDNVEQIEVLRGPQSVLYGSDAMGGVVSIRTRKGHGAPAGSLYFEAGSFDSYLERANLHGSEGIFNYSLSASRLDTGGISAASTSYGNHEADGFEDTALAARFGLDLSETLALNLYLRNIDSNSDLDNFGGAFGDDPNRVLDNREFMTRGEAVVKLFDGRLKQTWGISWNEQDLQDDNDPDQLNPGELLRSSYDGDLLKLDLQNQIALGERAQLLIGVETEEESASSEYFSDGAFGPFTSNFEETSERTNGYYAELALNADRRFFATFGVRVDDHESFGDHVTYRIAPVYLINATGTKLFGTVGTGFKAPSLFNLNSEFGNPELDPEESLGIDAGVEQKIYGDALTVGATWFWNKFDDLISFNPATFVFENVNQAKTRGLELMVRGTAGPALDSQIELTLMDTEDQSTGEDLLRRPHAKIGAGITYRPIDKLRLGAGLVFVGVRDDNDFSGAAPLRTQLSSYSLVNLNAGYRLLPNVELFLRVENLFDRSYEDVLGFGSPGAAGYGGLKFSL